MRTTYNGGVEGTFKSLPFGDGQVVTGADTDADHYAMLDHDTETDTDHAQFRQYSNTQGRWLSPDPYHGSYKWRNPQSLTGMCMQVTTRWRWWTRRDCSFALNATSTKPVAAAEVIRSIQAAFRPLAQQMVPMGIWMP